MVACLWRGRGATPGSSPHLRSPPPAGRLRQLVRTDLLDRHRPSRAGPHARSPLRARAAGRLRRWGTRKKLGHGTTRLAVVVIATPGRPALRPFRGEAISTLDSATTRLPRRLAMTEAKCGFHPGRVGHPAGVELVNRTRIPAKVTAEQEFEKIRPLAQSQGALVGPSSFEKYEFVLNDARMEAYRKVEGGRMLLYVCAVCDDHGRRDGVCRPLGDRPSAGAKRGHQP